MKFYPRERKREEQRERERGRREEGAGGLGARQTGEQERRGVRGIYGAHAGVQNTLRLKVETKTPIGAKPEIST